MEQPLNARPSWTESEDRVWADLRKRRQQRRNLLWFLFALVLLIIGNLTGFPGRVFT